MNSDQILLALLGAVLNGAMLLIGMWLGTRQSAKAVVKEIEMMLERSELVNLAKQTFTDQTLITKATKFFEEATVLVSSPEAKNFFKTLTEFFKSGTPSQSTETLKLPSPQDFKKRGDESA